MEIKVIKICDECGNPFFVSIRHPNQIRCKRKECVAKYKLRHAQKQRLKNGIYLWVDRKCIVCGKMYKASAFNQKTCSTNCANEKNRKRQQINRCNKTLYCKYCNKYIGYGKFKYCSNECKIKQYKKVKHLREKKQSDELTDEYIIGRLTQKSYLSFKDIKQYPELIKIKREQIKIIRELKS